jgi:hypothetical protein
MPVKWGDLFVKGWSETTGNEESDEKLGQTCQRKPMSALVTTLLFPVSLSLSVSLSIYIFFVLSNSIKLSVYPPSLHVCLSKPKLAPIIYMPIWTAVVIWQIYVILYQFSNLNTYWCSVVMIRQNDGLLMSFRIQPHKYSYLSLILEYMDCNNNGTVMTSN